MQYTADDSVELALDKLDSIVQKASVKEDEMDKFENYIVESLHKLKTVSSIRAQGDIQAILSKYRLHNITARITPTSPSILIYLNPVMMMHGMILQTFQIT